MAQMNRKKTIGILGGMGHLATVELFKLMVTHTDSMEDQEHIHILIDNNTKIPDRTNAILNNGPSPLNELVQSAKRLKEIGADFVIIPCNTSHYYMDKISLMAGIKVVNIIELTAKYIAATGVKNVGLLATSGSVQTMMYENILSKYQIHTVYQDAEEQKLVMGYIYNGVKPGNIEYSTDSVNNIISKMIRNAAEKVVLGCTELSIWINNFSNKDYLIDPMLILAMNAIQKAGYEINKEKRFL